MAGRSIKYFLIFCVTACGNRQGREAYEQELQRRADAAAEAQIDAAYAAVRSRCDSLLMYKVPLMADSVLRAMETDSAKQIPGP